MRLCRDLHDDGDSDEGGGAEKKNEANSELCVHAGALITVAVIIDVITVSIFVFVIHLMLIISCKRLSGDSNHFPSPLAVLAVLRAFGG